MSAAATADLIDSSITDSGFDFLFAHGGRWRVRHRRLRRRLARCHDWDVFEGTSEARPLLAGQGNVDDNLLHLPAELGGSYRAASLRAFDSKSGRWSIWWLDGRTPDVLDTPMVGTFEGGAGLFIGSTLLEGRPVVVRFLWLDTQTPTPRWEQAFSPDGGRTWETNWTMVFESAPR